MFMGPMLPRSDMSLEQRHTKNKSTCEQSERPGLAVYGPSCKQQRGAMQAIALLVSSGVWHIATGSDRQPLCLWMTLRCTFSSLAAADCLARACNILTLSNASHRANGFFYSCFPLWLSRIPRNYRCLRTEA
ncbi:hypothetical protein AVEN_61184-1 [Araneus ventricosus]|uniref:Uncharacterized protein n=1 Tax=Araneus ventricosus TaxID=182803 RepID=A0A4Y2TTH3_ARAVE|nr:hypothetical protein AVEN_61184-1 [Araneus ventricosus]